MLANTKHTKDRMVFSILSTLLFVTASSALYDTPSATAGNRTELETTNVITYAVPATKPTLIDEITTIDKFNKKIDGLEGIITKKDQALTDLKETYVSTDQALIKLKSFVGKSPYGFGDTPARWDCSGLTLWFYEKHRGITLPHSATAQMRGGKIVDAPIPGDIVAFSYGNSSSAFHVGIYVGSDMFIHAKNYSADTVLETVSGFAKNSIKVAYIRY
jgi:cell wall-associated NlpC family hydrolase